jgi:type I restriction enzyme S subunit
MNDLPKGWAMITLGEICSKPQYGWTCRAAKTGRIKYLRTTDISGDSIHWGNVPYCEELPDDIEKYRVYQDDILVARAGSVGISYRIEEVPFDTVFASYLIRFNALDGIEPKYIEFFLKSQDYWRSISDFTAGIAIPNVNASKLASLKLPLTPLAEQKRIVAKLEELLGKVDACQKRLEKIPIILERFRQSVLAAACSGRLTADWREKNPSASEQAPHSNDATLPEIPESWRWVKLPETGEMTRGRSRHRPRNEPSLLGGPYPFIQTGDIAQSGGRITTHKQTYSEAGLAQSRLWAAGTICITIAANIAESAILIYPACFPDSVVGIIANPKVAVAEYVEFFIRVAKADLATAQKNINIGILNEVQVPLPPLPEQEEIVRRVEAFFALADQIEARYKKAKAHIDKLTQSILAKTFRGELVPQDPNDLPADELLKQIREEKAKADNSKKAAKRKR